METIPALDESDLEQRLYPPSTALVIRKHRPLHDWSKVRKELARGDHHVTLALLWTEYKVEHPDGYQYSQFVDQYRRFERSSPSSCANTIVPVRKCSSTSATASR